MKITSDLHIHTTLSACCGDPEQKAENIIPLLAGKGFKLLAFTDHLWNNPSIPPSPWYSPQDGSKILGFLKEIHSSSFPVKILAGCEADMRAPGEFGITPELREKFDLVAMASDHFHMKGFVEQPEFPTPEKLAPHMLKFFRSAAASGLADTLVHPMMPLSYEDIYDRTVELISDQEFLDAFGIAADNRVGIEINASILYGNRMKAKYNPDSYVRVLSLARDAGCKFTFGSDSHSHAAFEMYHMIEDMTEKLGLTEEHLHPLLRT